jgi:chromate transporter
MTYLQLLLSFLKIGAFSFGGGYAMIPFFEKEIIIHSWTAAGDYAKIIAIAQVFPGPFAVDSSAYIGYKVGGILGAVIASLALCLPSFIALVYITKFYVQFKSNQYIQLLLSGVRPVVIGLLISAAYIIGLQPLLKTWGTNPSPLLKALPLIIIGFLLLKHTKINPILFIILFGMIGIFLF